MKSNGIDDGAIVVPEYTRNEFVVAINASVSESDVNRPKAASASVLSDPDANTRPVWFSDEQIGTAPAANATVATNRSILTTLRARVWINEYCTPFVVSIGGKRRCAKRTADNCSGICDARFGMKVILLYIETRTN